MPHGIVGPRIDIADHTRLGVEASNEVAVGAGIDNGRIAQVWSDPAALAAADVVPVPLCNPAAAARGGTNGGVVLLRAIRMIGKVVVERDTIELRGGLVHDGRPGAAAVSGDVRTTVVRFDHAHRIIRSDPDAVIVAMRRWNRRVALAAIGGAVETRVQEIHRVRILRIGKQVCVVPGALAQIIVLVDAHPGVAAIVGSKHAALFGLDQGVDALRIRRRNADPNAADDALRHAGGACQILPRLTAIRRFQQAAAGPAALQGVWRAINLPEPRINRAWIVRIE